MLNNESILGHPWTPGFLMKFLLSFLGFVAEMNIFPREEKVIFWDHFYLVTLNFLCFLDNHRLDSNPIIEVNTTHCHVLHKIIQIHKNL